MRTLLKTFLLLVILTGLAACSHQKVSKSNPTSGFLPLKERNATLSNLVDWSTTKNKATQLLQAITLDSTDIKAKLLLAQLYMQEARITGEHPYYYPATMQILNSVLRQEPSNFEALAFKSSVLLSLHHFKEALQVGKQAQSVNSNNGFIYGVLCDANVELGNYQEAVAMSDQMQAIRPGLESYSRASYLREIYGDNAGAIAAMKLAFEAGLSGSEESAWAGNTLAQLYLNTGDLKNAEALSNFILEQRTNYGFSYNTLGEIELARKRYDKALVYFNKAIECLPEFSFYENKALAFEAIGKNDQAADIYKMTLKMLEEDAQSGHYADMDMAKVYLKLNRFDKALEYATVEYNRRPLNKDVNQTMAMVWYKKGDPTKAKKHLDIAMRMGTQNAELLKLAADIEFELGHSKQGLALEIKAKGINPFVAVTTSKKS